MKMYEHLGKKVLCKAYYKKAHDGVHITCYDEDGLFCSTSQKPIATAFAYDRHGKEAELCFEGDGVEKILHELIEKHFVGVCVGEKTIPITEYLYSDTNWDWIGREYKEIGKEIKDACECYVVYYANNRKRYVPKDYCEFMKGGA